MDNNEFTDEDSLFEDFDGAGEGTGGELAGELAGESVEDASTSTSNIREDLGEPAAPPQELPSELTGVERFLSSYGVNGGLISYEDGETAKFSDLPAEEQEEVLKSLTEGSIPSVEEKYNLDEREIELLNVLRQEDTTPEEFINNLVDYRLKAVLAQRDAGSIDFENMPNEAMFVRHLKDNNPDMSADEIADEVTAAQRLTTFDSTVDAIKAGYLANQRLASDKSDALASDAFTEDLELQRAHVVQTVEGMDDIAGAPITADMKEYLLHDIMELNDNKDPILMEKIFSAPENMMKANWFLSYGEDYIKNLNDYWKKEVSKATKGAYDHAVRGMPGEPQSRSHPAAAPVQNNYLGGGGSNSGFGEVVDEDDLFD